MVSLQTSGMTLREILSEFEREVIEKALEESGWSVTKAAKILKISRQNLQRRIRKLKIKNN